ncbi:hypothetical protein ACCS66_36550 [Rhizobium ruizarguesonis]
MRPRGPRRSILAQVQPDFCNIMTAPAATADGRATAFRWTEQARSGIAQRPPLPPLQDERQPLSPSLCLGGGQRRTSIVKLRALTGLPGGLTACLSAFEWRRRRRDQFARNRVQRGPLGVYGRIQGGGSGGRGGGGGGREEAIKNRHGDAPSERSPG